MKSSAFLPMLAGAAAVAAAIVATRRASDAEQRLAMLRDAHTQRATQHHEALARLTAELNTAQQELRRLRGEGRFHAAMTVGEAVTADPRAGQVLAAFHIGGCSGCAADDGDTLRYAAGSSGQDLDRLLAALNALDGDSADEVAAMLERRPNVRIEL